MNKLNHTNNIDKKNNSNHINQLNKIPVKGISRMKQKPSNKHLINIFILVLVFIFIFISLSSVLSTQQNGFLFRLDTVDIKHYPGVDSVKQVSIDYQSVVSHRVKFSEAGILSGNDFEINTTDDNVYNIGVLYPDQPKEFYLNSTRYQEEFSSLTLTGNIAEGGDYDETKHAGVKFRNPVPITPNTKSVEYYAYSNVKNSYICFEMEAYNKRGLKIREFTQKVPIGRTYEWYMDSFNLQLSDSAPSISSLVLVGVYVEFLTRCVPNGSFRVSVSELTTNNIVKPRNDSRFPAKRNYEDFEIPELTMSKWKMMLGSDPLSFEGNITFSKHMNETNSIPNGGEYYIEMNPESLQGHRDLVIDFGDDYFLPTRNKITILVRGRSMGEELSFILEDSRHVYYEISAGYIDFNQWKSLEVDVPIGNYVSFLDKKTSTPYVKLVGLKIRSGYDGKIGLMIDDISSIIHD